jgi:hypothetical protein
MTREKPAIAFSRRFCIIKPMRAPLRTSVLALSLLFFLAAPGLFAQSFSCGLSSGLHLQYSADTLRLLPGLGATAVLSANPFEFEARVFAGGFLGWSVWAELDALYVFHLGGWAPRLGLSVNLDFGEYVFHASSSSDYVLPAPPEPGLALVAKLFVLDLGSFTVTAGRLLVGTGFQYIGRVLVVQIELFGLAYAF